MSRTPFSASRPRCGSTFRPQLEALEDRFAPGSLFGTSPGPLIEPGGAGAVRAREATDLAVLAGIAAGQSQGTTKTPSPVAAGQSQGATRTPSDVVDFDTRSIVVGSSTLIRTDHGVTAHLTATGLPPGVYTFWMKVDTHLPDGSTVTVSGRLAGHRPTVGEMRSRMWSAATSTPSRSSMSCPSA